MKQSHALEICQIRQIDNHTFEIVWNNDKVLHYRLADLQAECPCASCMDEMTGKRRAPEQMLNENVRARRIYSVGRYAIRVEYTLGCSLGIYSYEFLHERGKTP